MSLLVRGGVLVLPWGVFDGVDVLVVDGVVEAVGYGLRLWGVRVEERIDARGLLVLPGAVDEHVHMREPGLTYKDDFLHGSMDAAAGGTTTVIDMPNTLPPVDSGERLVEKAGLLNGRAYVDYALYGVLRSGNIDRFMEMVEAGAAGFKIFMGPTTGNIPSPSDPEIIEAMELSARTGTPIAFHAENWELVEYYTEKAVKEHGDTPLTHLYARPPICEEEATRRLILYTKHTGAKTLIVHLSSMEAAEAVREAKQRGINIYAETTPHYLLLDSTHYQAYGAAMKVNPPIREPHHREALWRALRDGTITNIGSDHAPHADHEKNTTITKAAAGFSAARTLLPLMIDQALRGKLPLTKLVQIVSANPARLFNLYPYKGTIQPGSSGDIAIIDPHGETTITPEKLYSRSKTTPFTSWRLRGKHRYTVLRGTVVAENEEITADKPPGKWIKPKETLIATQRRKNK